LKVEKQGSYPATKRHALYHKAPKCVTCGKHTWVDFNKIEADKRKQELLQIRDEQYSSRIGRPRLGKTHQPSKEGKRRKNAISKAKQLARKGRRGAYRFKGYELLFNVLDIAYVPMERYEYHRARYMRKGKPFNLQRSWGFKLPNSRKCNLPSTVVQSLIGIYSNPVLVPVQPKPARAKVVKRTPRRRTRSDSLSRAINACTELSIEELVYRPGLVARTIAEIELRFRRDNTYRVPEDLEFALNGVNEYFREKEVRRAVNELLNIPGSTRVPQTSKEIEELLSEDSRRSIERKRLRAERRLAVLASPQSNSGP
jgi:hypothetical protein